MMCTQSFLRLGTTMRQNNTTLKMSITKFDFVVLKMRTTKMHFVVRICGSQYDEQWYRVAENIFYIPIHRKWHFQFV